MVKYSRSRNVRRRKRRKTITKKSRRTTNTKKKNRRRTNTKKKSRRTRRRKTNRKRINIRGGMDAPEQRDRPPVAAGGLPVGWEEKTDPASGKKYYVNHERKVTQWDRPSEKHMVNVKFTAALGQGNVEVDLEEYKGKKESDMYDFIKKILQLIKEYHREQGIPLPPSYVNPNPGLFSLSTKKGDQLSSDIHTRGITPKTPEQKKGIIQKSNSLNLVYAPLPLRPKSDGEIIELKGKISLLEEEGIKTGKDLSRDLLRFKKVLKDVLARKTAFVGSLVDIDESSLGEGPATAGVLPAEWEEKTDPTSGKKYYVNHERKVTQWDRPT